MKAIKDDFSRFEYEGWERVADKYDSVWSSLTRQFIPYLVNAVEVSPGMSVLDVACGPGYVSEAIRKLGAISTGIDFSEKMVAIAKKMFPGIRFAQGDAQNLSCDDGSFDRVLVNFGLMHLSRPEQACGRGLGLPTPHRRRRLRTGPLPGRCSPGEFGALPRGAAAEHAADARLLRHDVRHARDPGGAGDGPVQA